MEQKTWAKGQKSAKVPRVLIFGFFVSKHVPSCGRVGFPEQLQQPHLRESKIIKSLDSGVVGSLLILHLHVTYSYQHSAMGLELKAWTSDCLKYFGLGQVSKQYSFRILLLNIRVRRGFKQVFFGHYVFNVLSIILNDPLVFGNHEQWNPPL